MTEQFDTLLKEAVILQKQKEVDDFKNTPPMVFREKFSRKMEKVLQNPHRRITVRQIVAITLAAITVLTFLGMAALPELRNPFRRPLLTIDQEHAGYGSAAELNHGVLYLIAGSGEDGWRIETRVIETNEVSAFPIPALDGVDIQWRDLSVYDGTFRLLGYSDSFRYYIVSESGEVLREYPAPLLDEYLDDPSMITYHVQLMGDTIVISCNRRESLHSTSDELHLYDPIEETHRYLGDNIVSFSTSGNILFLIAENSDDVFLSNGYHPYTLYRMTAPDENAEFVSYIDTIVPICAYGDTTAYDEKHNRLYSTRGKQLIATDLETGQYSIAMESDTYFTINRIQDGLLLYSSEGAYRIYKTPAEYFEMTDRNQLTALRIAQPSPTPEFSEKSEAYSAVFRTMWEENYNMFGTYVYTADYENTILTKLQNGDDDFDIFYLDSGMPHLFSGEYLTDLTDYSVITSSYNAMLPGVKSLCTVDGVTGLVPVSMYTLMMRRDNSLCSEVLEVPASLDELSDLVKTPIRSLQYSSRLLSGSALHTLLLPWFEQISDNYISGRLSRREAEDAMTDLFRLAEVLPDAKHVWIGSGSFLKKAYLMCVQNEGILSTVPAQGNITVAPMTKATDTCAWSFNGGYYAVNPNSPNKKEAAAFLAYFTMHFRNPENGNLSIAQLYEGFDPAAVPETEATYNSIYTGYPPSLEGSEAAYEVFRDQLKNSVRTREIFGYSQYLSSAVQGVLGGTLTPETAAQETLDFIDGRVSQ